MKIIESANRYEYFISRITHGIMYDDITQKLPGENHRLIFKMKKVNGKNKLVMKQ